MSRDVTVYFRFVCPSRVRHAAPVASQRCHAYTNVIGKSPPHVPVLAVRSSPTLATPVRSGATVLLGAKCGFGIVGKVWFVMVKSEPALFVAVIHTRSACPMSSAVWMYVEDVAPGI